MTVATALAITLGIGLYVATYLYMRYEHSQSGQYATVPLSHTEVYYDTDRFFISSLAGLHLPIARAEAMIRGMELRIRIGAFEGHSENYGREEYDAYDELGFNVIESD